MHHDETCATIRQATSPLGSLRNYCLAFRYARRTIRGQTSSEPAAVRVAAAGALLSIATDDVRPHIRSCTCIHVAWTVVIPVGSTGRRRLQPMRSEAGLEVVTGPLTHDRRTLDRPKSILKNVDPRYERVTPSEDIYWGLEMV
jgi:hypothetical protein